MLVRPKVLDKKKRVRFHRKLLKNNRGKSNHCNSLDIIELSKSLLYDFFYRLYAFGGCAKESSLCLY